jgi:peptidoglycan hydrolase-like protein with peptidoglycan-binding domain
VKNRIVKVMAASVLALILTAAPTTQSFAWCGGSCWGYGNGGYYGNGGRYNPPANQSNTTQYSAPTPISQPAPSTSQSASRTNRNDFDPTIFDVQEILFEEEYYDGEVDGLLGPQTKAALLRFQEENNIPETKNINVVKLKADKTTLKALGL